mmetsp:Transcript_33163/g.84712  ORF Transcript_33163/g.84712 Transcript_33163/m.84712 type:complete len:573 (+) Transcript_33163:96-1814(+)
MRTRAPGRVSRRLLALAFKRLEQFLHPLGLAPLAPHAPAELLAHELHDARDCLPARGSVQEGEAGPVREKVDRSGGVLLLDAVNDLRLDDGVAAHEPLAQLALLGDLGDAKAAVAVRMRQVLCHPRVDGARAVGHHIVLRNLGVVGAAPAGSAHERQRLGGGGARALDGASGERLVHRLLRHLPVRRPLAARHSDEAAGIGGDDVVAADACGVAGVGVARKRPDAGPCRQHVLAPDIHGEQVLDLADDEVDLLLGGLGPHRDVGFGVRGADDGVVEPGQHEQHAAVLCARHDEAVVVGGVVVGEHEVHARRGGDHLGGVLLVHLAHFVHEGAGRVDHRLGIHIKLGARLIVFHLGARHLPLLILDEPDHLRVIGNGGATQRGGARQRDRHARVVELAVKIDNHALERRPFRVHGAEGGKVALRVAAAAVLGRLQRAAQGHQVVRLHAGPEVDGLPPGPAGHHDRKRVGQVRRVLQQALALRERLVHELQLAVVQAQRGLLQVAHAAVHQLGGARGGAGREVIALHQRGAQPAAGGVHGDAGASGTAADDEQVEGLGFGARAQARQLLLARRH